MKPMAKIIRASGLAVIAPALLWLSGCLKDSNNPTGTTGNSSEREPIREAKLLMGNWDLIEIAVNGTHHDVWDISEGDFVQVDEKVDLTNNNEFLQINADDSYITSIYGLSDPVEGYVEAMLEVAVGTSDSMWYNGNGFPVAGTWELTDSILTLIGPHFSEPVFTVKKVVAYRNNDSLILIIPVPDTTIWNLDITYRGILN